jgi:hypothetical protein
MRLCHELVALAIAETPNDYVFEDAASLVAVVIKWAAK